MKVAPPSSTIQDLIDFLDPNFLGSTPLHRSDLFPRPANQIKIYDFFASSPQTHAPLPTSQPLFIDTKPSHIRTSPESSSIVLSFEIPKRHIYRIQYGVKPQSKRNMFTASAVLIVSLLFCRSIFKSK